MRDSIEFSVFELLSVYWFILEPQNYNRDQARKSTRRCLQSPDLPAFVAEDLMAHRERELKECFAFTVKFRIRLSSEASVDDSNTLQVTRKIIVRCRTISSTVSHKSQNAERTHETLPG